MPDLLARVVFPATGREHHLAVLRVGLEDVTRADAAADVLATGEITDVAVPAQGAVIDVRVATPPSGDPRRRVTVRAHGSVTGAAGFEPGDFLTTTSVPAAEDGVDVPVELVR